jgi:hypothetical protein
MSKLVPALLAVVVVGGGAALFWFAGSDAPPDGPQEPPPAPKEPAPQEGGGEKAAPPKPADPPPAPPPAAKKKWDEGPPLAEPPAEPVPGAGLRFAFPQWPEAALVDWNQVGLFARKTQRRLRRVAIRVAEGESFEKVRGELDEAFAPVGHAAMPLVGPYLALDVDPTNPFGSVMAFPPFESNTLAATLDAWKRPLTDEQAKAVHELYRTHATAWLENRPVTPEGRTLEQVTAIAKSRAVLQAKLEEVLDETQEDALWPPEVKGRLGLDIFSPSTVLRERVIIVQAEDEAAVRLEIAQRILAESGLGHMTPDRIEKPLGEWLETMPDGWSKGPRSHFARAGLLTYEELSPWLDGLPKLLRTLETSGPRRDPRFHRVRRVPVPVR